MTPTVLLVDDAEEFRQLAAQFLAIEWPDVAVDEWDPHARGEIPESHSLAGYDALLLDYQLGVADGLDWLAALRKRADCPPVVFLTGAGNENVASTAMKQGAFDYLPKRDLSRARLVDAVRAAAAERAAHTPASRAQRPEAAASLDEASRYPITAKFSAGAGAGRMDEVAINGYRVLKKLGSGGMSTVYLAERVADGLRVVFKIMDAKLTEENEFLMRFIQEYGLVSRINSPFVVLIYDQGFTDRHAYIAMEEFTGGDLRARIRKGLAPEAALDTVEHIARALQAVHEQGIVHRDLKPDNIMFRANGSLALADFGIAKMHSDGANLTAHGDVLGTPHYLSPEQACAQPLDGRSDLYSLGIVLFEMLTGRRPFQADDALGLALKHVNEPLPRLPEELRRWQELLDCLTAKRPEDRFPGARELIAYLEENAALLRERGELPLLDQARLGKLRADFAPRPGAFEQMLAKFLDSAARQTARIGAALAAGDARELELQAHSLKGGAGAFGAPRLAAAAAELEEHARAGDLPGAAALARHAGECARVTLAALARSEAGPG